MPWLDTVHNAITNKSTSLNVSGNGEYSLLSDCDIIQISHILNTETHSIIDLSICHTKLTSVGMRSIVSIIKENQLRSLQLAIRTECIEWEVIFDAIKNSNITHLNIESSSISGDEVKALFNCIKSSNLISLKINPKLIGDEDFSKIIEDSRVISINDISHNNILCNQTHATNLHLLNAISDNVQRILKLVKEFGKIFLNDKNEFKDFNQIQKNEKLKLIEIIKKSGINVFAHYVKEFCTVLEGKTIDTIIDQLSEICKDGLISNSTNIDPYINNVMPFLTLKDIMSANSTTKTNPENVTTHHNEACQAPDDNNVQNVTDTHRDVACQVPSDNYGLEALQLTGNIIDTWEICD